MGNDRSDDGHAKRKPQTIMDERSRPGYTVGRRVSAKNESPQPDQGIRQKYTPKNDNQILVIRKLRIDRPPPDQPGKQ